MFDKELVGRLYQEAGIYTIQWLGVLNHMMGVAHVAGFLGSKLKEHNIVIDVELLETAAAIHDIGRVFNDTNQGHHLEGLEFLWKQRVDEKIIRIVKKHEVYSFNKGAIPEPSSWEEKILILADLAFSDHIMPVKERVEDIVKRLSLSPEKAKFVRKKSQEIYQEVSEIISPESLPF